MEKQIFTVILTKDERDALQKLVESEGYRQVGPWFRHLIRKSDAQQKARLTTTANA